METFVALVFVTALAVGGAIAETVNFDGLKTGTPPAGWTATQTGKGQAKWEVVEDDSAPSRPNVLKQSSIADYPLCFNNDTNIKDGFVEVKFKSVAGLQDQVRQYHALRRLRQRAASTLSKAGNPAGK